VSNTAIVDLHYKDHHSHRMTRRFLDALQEIHVKRICQWWAKLGRKLSSDVRRTGISPKTSTRARPKTSRRRKITLTGNLHKLMWALAQRSCSSFIIITSWHLHVQVFALGESTGDESTYCIVIQRMPIWNIRKSRSTTNCLSKTSAHKAFKEITAWVLLIVEFNEVNMMALQTRL